jgi:ABC-type branched-subunit amino acid transport system substrate-binding protein
VEALEGSGQPIPLLTFALVPDDSSSNRGYGYQSFLVKFLPNVRSIVERIVDYSVNYLGYRTFGIFYPDENFGQQAKEAFLQAVQ